MIAHIRGKLVKDGENLHDRLEDNLTGNAFGALRYLPAELGWSRVFESVDFVTAPSTGICEKLRNFHQILKILNTPSPY